MRLERITVKSTDGMDVPGYLVEPEKALGGVVVAHGYGACKEEMLGITVKLAEKGLTALAIDLRGHGEHPAPLDLDVLKDIEGAVAYLRTRFVKVAALGHSLGGRLALMSSADLVIGLSPAVAPQITEEGKELLRLNGTKVRQPHGDFILELMGSLGPVPDQPKPKLLLIGARDVPGIMIGARQLNGKLSELRFAEIEEGLLPEMTPKIKLEYVPRWLNHHELRYNEPAFTTISGWLLEKLTA